MTRTVSGACAVGAWMACWALSAAARAAEPSAVAVIAPSALPARDLQQANLRVSEFGRYAISVHSAQGMAIELVDRMAGSLAKAGEAGREDGRIDLFLDRGEYLLLLRGHERGRGQAQLAVVPAVERNPPPGPLLVELKPVAAELADHDQRSYWLQLAEPRSIFLEAAGRNLADLRLWRDGAWLEDATPQCAVRQPVLGQPLLDCRIAARLTAGLYRVAAYGGAGQPWAEASEEHPLHLRWGIPRLAGAGRQRFEMSAFGSDRFLAPAETNYFRLELPAPGNASLRVGTVHPREPLLSAAQGAGDVRKESLPPVAEVLLDENTEAASAEAGGAEAAVTDEEETAAPADEEMPAETTGEQTIQDNIDATEEPAPEPTEPTEAAETPETPETAEPPEEPQPPSEPSASAPEEPPWRWVEVAAPPGQSYVLQQFDLRTVYTFARSGLYWIATTHVGHPGDSIDATAVLTAVEEKEGHRRERLLAVSAIKLPWARRFNLIDLQQPTTLFFEVAQAGRYEVAARGVEALFRVEPFLLSRPANYAPPPRKRAGSSWDLNPGLHVLTIDPLAKGILDLGLGPAGGAASLLSGIGTPAAAAPRAAARFGAVELKAGEQYTVAVNLQPGVKAGLVLRRSPVDLDEALPLALEPGETVELQGEAPAAGTLRALAEGGSPLPVSVDEGERQTERSLDAGIHRIAVHNPGAETVVAALVFARRELAAEASLPEVPAAALAALPQFSPLVPGRPLALDLGRGATATFLVHAGRPGLYAMTATGLLATAGNLRTRTVTSLARAQQNGGGRNFLLQSYLGEGDYQLTVATQGDSRGHLGVALQEAALLDGGRLDLGLPARASLRAGEGLVYRFSVTRAGDYRLRGLGPGFVYRCRLETEHGWPVGKPESPADFTRRLLPGTYRLLLLPQPLASRAVTLLEAVEKPKRGEGHGPTALPLGVRLTHLWKEPAEGAPRESDLWTFDLPAPARLRLELGGEMQGRLRHDAVDAIDTGAAGAEPVLVPPGRPWEGDLQAGAYRLEVECSRRNNLVTYDVLAQPDALVPGMTRDVQAPGEVMVAVGREQLVEISSLAPAPVRAVLLDGGGETVARAEERPDDWSFLLTRRLSPGRYRLRVEPRAGGALAVRVSLRTPLEREEPAATLPLSRELNPGADVILLPLNVPAGGSLLAVSARSSENIGCALEVETDGAWRTLASEVGRMVRLAAALDAGAGAARRRRLRLWSLDRRGSPLQVQTYAVEARARSEKDLRQGVELAAIPGAEPVWRAGVVDLDRPGVLRLSSGEGNPRWAGAPGEILRPPLDGLLVPQGKRLWLTVDGMAGSAALRAERVAMPNAGTTLLRLGAGERATSDLAGSGELASARAGTVLVWARAALGQPGLKFSGVTGPTSGLAVAEGAAVAAALGSHARSVEVWNAAPGEAAIEVELQQARVPAALARPAGWGTSAGVLDGPSAQRFDLPAGRKRLRLALGAGTVGLLADGETVRSAHWHGGRPFEETLESDASSLVLVHPGADHDPYQVEIQAASDSAVLTLGHPQELRFDRRGILRVAVEGRPGAPCRLHARGRDLAATFVGEDGIVRRGPDLDVVPPGTLILDHGSGSALVWLESPGKPPWESALGAPVLAVRAPSVVVLGGGSDARLQIVAPAPSVVQVRTGAPVTSVIERGETTNVEVHLEGARLDLLAPRGEVSVLLHALGGALLSGVAEVTSSPVVELGEGLGDPVLLAPGGRRYFSFRVETKRRIGAGVRSDSAAVECELATADGAVVGRGVVEMVDLAPGSYVLSLALPAHAAAATARPVLVGLRLPSSGPPEEVIQRYLQQAARPLPAPPSGSDTP